MLNNGHGRHTSHRTGQEGKKERKQIDRLMPERERLESEREVLVGGPHSLSCAL